MATRNPPQASSSQNLITRRRFVYSSVLAAGALMIPIPAGAARARYKSPNEKLNIAVIGAGGKGAGDTDHCAELGENIVALCDVDEDTLNARRQKYPQAKPYRDYPKILDDIGRHIDPVLLATPAHHHA